MMSMRHHDKDVGFLSFFLAFCVWMLLYSFGGRIPLRPPCIIWGFLFWVLWFWFLGKWEVTSHVM